MLWQTDILQLFDSRPLVMALICSQYPCCYLHTHLNTLYVFVGASTSSKRPRCARLILQPFCQFIVLMVVQNSKCSKIINECDIYKYIDRCQSVIFHGTRMTSVQSCSLKVSLFFICVEAKQMSPQRQPVPFKL